MSQHPSELAPPSLALAPYPLDAASLRALARAAPQPLAEDHPTSHALAALLAWNVSLETGDQQHQATFLAHARHLLEQASPIGAAGVGWPVLTRLEMLPEPVPLLSASTQGLALSVLVRAFHLTGEAAFLQMAQRATSAFRDDIFDGGLCAPVGSAGLFFEEVAGYPAAHHLHACLLALCGLFDYLAVSPDARLTEQMRRCLDTLASLLPRFDIGYWSRADLFSPALADRDRHALHSALLRALAAASGDAAWAAVAERWSGSQRSLVALLRVRAHNALARVRCLLWRLFQPATSSPASLSPENPPPSGAWSVCVPITAFPVVGGMRSVLAGVAQAMRGVWEIEYLTWHIGPQHDAYRIQAFGGPHASYWQFPNVWLYALAGWRRLRALFDSGQEYRVVLPQDGLSTGAFAALAARLSGCRVVCMDHGNIPLLFSPNYRRERLNTLATSPWLVRLLSRLRFVCYWPSLRLLAAIVTHTTERFLLGGDDVELIYRQRLGVSPERIFRFPYLIDTARYAPCQGEARATRRAEWHLPADGIVIAMLNRLAPEKGVDIAVQGVSQALEDLPAELRSRVRLVIAGDGPLRGQVEEAIRRAHLEDTCVLLGEVTPDDVARLLSISDLFLFTAIRDSNSVAVLEAMGAGLLVISSSVPDTKAALLADGRGVVVPVGDAHAVSVALAAALTDLPRCQEMGALARAYIEDHHSASVVRRCLLRATGWPLEARPAQGEASPGHVTPAPAGASLISEQSGA